MTTIFPGRYTAAPDKPYLVFLIGMRVNNLLAVRKWLGTFRVMTRILPVLMQHPEKGLLGGTFWFGWGQIMLVQYWSSFEALEAFARSKDEPHLPGWQWFNKTIGADGTVGFWHETYTVDPTKCESVYGNMPLFGLAAATTHVPATGRRETARRRIGGESEPAVPSATEETVHIS